MKQIITLLFATLPLISFSQSDPREFNHGTCIVKYLDNNKYYLTWSSSYPYGWEHDIYKSKIYFDTNGNLVTETPDQVFINTNEAQEPVNSVINSDNNYMLTVWEDGSGANAPNVSGQINLPDGTIIRQNWIIAGGSGSQHSAYTSHLSDKFLIFYADEAPPSTGGAVVKAKVINDTTGNELQTINLTPNNEDHWWPVSVSNSDNTKTLVVWGNDGYSVRGTVLKDNSGIIEEVGAQQDYLTNTQQYYYQVTWLDHISKFLLIARNGANNNITDESKICLIDTLGNITNSTLVNGGILREAKMIAKWSANHQSYSIFYPSGTNSLTQIFINSTGTISSTSNQITNLPELSTIEWTSTGIWAEFVEDNNGNDLFGNDYIALFIMNDTNSNNIIKIPVRLDAELITSLSLVDTNNTDFQIYPNPCKNSIYFSNEYLGLDYIIYSTNGKVITKNTVTNNSVDISFLENGNYLIYFKTKTFKITKIN
jgi:hypothetical protein